MGGMDEATRRLLGRARRIGLRAGPDCAHCQRGYENHEYWCMGGCMAGFGTRVVGFCGPAGAGKSTAAEWLAKAWRFKRVRFAGPLKAMMAALGLSEAEIEGDRKETPSPLLCGRTPRQAMQWLGTEWGRQMIGDDLWIEAWHKAVGDIVTESIGQSALIVADDVRFGNEAAAIRALGGVVVRIDRPGAGAVSGGTHVSERPDFTPDLTIQNDGARADFLRRIDDFAQSLRARQITVS